MRRKPREIMIIDYAKCVRVQPGDEWYARESTPYRCPDCATGGGRLTPQSRSARLRFVGDAVPQCSDHEVPVDMVPV